MAKNIRIIPRLDIKGPNLVKGIHLEGLRVLGKPEEFARFYYENGADELIYMDVVASLYNRNSLQEMISRTAKDIFIPLTVGGGLRSVDDIRSVLRSGADKVSLNTAAIRNPDFIHNASRIFGSSTIVVAIEAIKQNDGRYLAYIDNGREYTGVEVVSWARKVEQLGAGEILLTSVDRDGTGSGYDIDLVAKVARSVSIPVIASGGAGKPEDIRKVIIEGSADAVAVASLLHYGMLGMIRHDFDSFAEGNIEFIKTGRNFSKFQPVSLQGIKKYLIKEGVMCRPQEEQKICA
jgi:cyclase